MIFLSDDKVVEEDPKGRQNRRERMDRKKKDRRKPKGEKTRFFEEEDERYWRDEIRRYQDK